MPGHITPASGSREGRHHLQPQAGGMQQPSNSEKVRSAIFARNGNGAGALGRAALERTMERAGRRGSVRSDGTIIIPPLSFDRLIEISEQAFQRGQAAEFLSLLIPGRTSLRLYVGKNNFFIPNVYYLANSLVASQNGMRMVESRVENALGRMLEVRHLLGREIRQALRLERKQDGSRSADITFDEYFMLFRQKHAPAQRRRCAMCPEKSQEKLTVHHIIPNGDLRAHHERLKKLKGRDYLRGQGGKKRLAGDVASNGITLCKKCHMHLEREINGELIPESKQSNYGTLIVSDLHIVVAKKIAQYWTNVLHDGKPEEYQRILALEANFALHCMESIIH